MAILIVDDHAANRELLRAQLENEGFAVLEAGDGAEGLQVLECKPVEAVISEILMPNMDGYRFCSEVRRSERFRALPFILYTSTDTSPGDRELATTVAADGYLSKPAATADLLKALEKAKEQSKHRKAALTFTGGTTSLMQRYNTVLANKLEERNRALAATVGKLERAYATISEMNQDLERSIHERTAELESANGRLVRKQEEIQSFYHTLSHELKTPLTSGREFISLMEEGLAGPITETQKEYLALTKESCDQMAHCLDDLLDATRLDTGKLSLEVKQDSLVKLARRVLKSLAPAIAAKSVLLETEFDEALPDIPFDDYRITQVITNLVNNALKFTPEEGRIRVEIHQSASTAGMVEVSISDTGRGIPMDHLDQIFDRLHQVKDRDAAVGGGMGLGLYLCRELVALHGGDIHVESEVGHGTRFSFLLPMQPPARSSLPDTEPAMAAGAAELSTSS